MPSGSCKFSDSSQGEINRYKKNSPVPFDVVLLDLSLPDSQGLATVSRLSEAIPSVPIVVLTNFKDDELALDAIRCGAQDYLVKGKLHPEVLSRAIRYAIERKRTEEELKHVNETLEEQVSDRTQALVQSNQSLVHEIERRQGLEGRLVMEKQLAEVALHSIGDAVIVVNKLRQIQSLNPAAEQLFGWTASSAMGFPCEEVLELDYGEVRRTLADGFQRVFAFGDRVTGAGCLNFVNRRGQAFILEISIAPIRLYMGNIEGAVIVCRDVTETQRMSANLAWQATHDALTRLANRREFEETLITSLQEVADERISHALCYLDLDQFKVINDTSGHEAGDVLLCRVAQSLMRLVGPGDLLARLGGDEFGILLRNCTLGEATVKMQAIVEQLHSQFVWGDNVFNISASAGLVLLEQSIDDVAGALGMADTAMYLSKEAGGNRLSVYHPNDQMIQRRRCDMQWTSRIRQALAANRFCLFSQSIMPLYRAQGGEYCLEVLLRLRDKSGNLVPPYRFIPAAERYDLMPELDRWVVKTLLDQLTEHLEDGSRSRPTGWRYFVNLSGASFDDELFADFLIEQLQRPILESVDICFEVTETAAISNLNQAVNLIQRVQAVGGTFALDDFGSGMSSLTYLNTLPVNYLKIDGQFVKSVATDPVSQAMVEAIRHISRSLGLKVIAEGVEDTAVLRTVEKLGVDYVQGYAIDLPSPLTLPCRREQSKVSSRSLNLVS
ncbi:MAG: EAL domain-containing protein [Cyanobacteria bacterium P01_D01_bin.73]